MYISVNTVLYFSVSTVLYISVENTIVYLSEVQYMVHLGGVQYCTSPSSTVLTIVVYYALVFAMQYVICVIALATDSAQRRRFNGRTAVQRG